MMDVVITRTPAKEIKGILNMEIVSVAAAVIPVGQIVHLLIGVMVMRSKLTNRPMDVGGDSTKLSVRNHIVKEI